MDTALLQALTALPRPEQQPASIDAAHIPGVRRVWTVPARVRGFTGWAELLAELEAALRSGGSAVMQAETGMGGSRRVLGAYHPEALIAAFLLGMVLWPLGDCQQARQLHNDTVTRSRRVLGADHPVTLRSASFLGLTLGSMGEHQQARQLQNDTRTRLGRVLGEDHPDTITSAHNLAADLRALGIPKTYESAGARGWR